MNRSITACVAAVALMVAGCGQVPTDKAGGSPEVITARLANPYGNLTYVPQVKAFVDAAERVSSGAIRIETVDEWGHFEPGFETKLIADVAEGEVELGWVGTRAFDLDGQTALRALTAPMLVDSYALQRVLLGGELTGDMLAELNAPGVKGLAILGGGLRKPFSVTKPMVSLADFRSTTFQSFESELNGAATKALGAKPSQTGPTGLDAGLVDGSIDGFEKQLSTVLINGTHRLAPYVAVDVNLWPETVAVIAGNSWLGSLSQQQRDWLGEAARVAASVSVDTLPDDAKSLATLCGLGLRAGRSTPAQLDELRQALRPVYDDLGRDPLTAQFLTRIERAKATLPAPAPLAVPENCTGPAPAVTTTPSASSGPPATPGGEAAAIEGVYRWTLTSAAAEQAGWPEDPRYPFPHVFTMTLRDGRWSHSVRDAIRAADYGGGTYRVETGVLQLSWDDGGAVMSFGFEADEDGNLSLDPEPGTNLEDSFVIASQPWERIG